MKTPIAIATFSQGHKNRADYQFLINRNIAIAQNLLPNLPANSYDVVIFHNGDIPAKDQTYISKVSGLKLKFVDVKKSAPQTAFQAIRERASAINPEQTKNLFTQHLCHFWFVDFLDYFQNYEYLIHIDEGSLLLSCPNPIEILQSQNLKFLSAEQINQDPYSMVALPELCHFFRASRSEPKIEFPYPFMTPRTNCMVLDLDFFRSSSSFLEFQKIIDSSGMIFSHSWSLGSIWAAFLMLYVDPNQNGISCRGISYFDYPAGSVINPLPEQLSSLFNVALNKPATVNAEYYPPFDKIESSAANAVSGHFFGKYTFHTQTADNPTWEVDLLQSYPIEAIQIYNRGDGQFLRAIGMIIECSEDGSNYECLHQQNEVFFGLPRGPLLLDFRLTGKKVKGRFIRLRIPREECLHLDQVEIYSSMPSVDSSPLTNSNEVFPDDVTAAKEQKNQAQPEV